VFSRWAPPFPPEAKEARTPFACKKIGRAVKSFNDTVWKDIRSGEFMSRVDLKPLTSLVLSSRVDLVVQLLKAKFSIEDLRDRLVKTGIAPIYEARCCVCSLSENALPRRLQETWPGELDVVRHTQASTTWLFEIFREKLGRGQDRTSWARRGEQSFRRGRGTLWERGPLHEALEEVRHSIVHPERPYIPRRTVLCGKTATPSKKRRLWPSGSVTPVDASRGVTVNLE